MNDWSKSRSATLIENAGKILSLITAALLVLSTAYDFSFLSALGLKFEEFPTTIADHVRSAVVWAPHALLYIAAFATYEMVMRIIEKGMSEEELIARSPSPRFTRAFRRSPKIFLGILLAIMICISLLFSTSNQGLFFIALFGWGSLSFSVVQHPRLGANFTPTSRRLFVTIPMIIIWVASLGYSSGESMMNSTKPIWKVEVKGVSGNEIHMLVGMRQFSTAAVLIEAGAHVSIIPSNSIIRADALRMPDADTPRICKWLGFECTRSNSTKP